MQISSNASEMMQNQPRLANQAPPRKINPRMIGLTIALCNKIVNPAFFARANWHMKNAEKEAKPANAAPSAP